jgi:hypothetical protein
LSDTLSQYSLEMTLLSSTGPIITILHEEDTNKEGWLISPGSSTSPVDPTWIKLGPLMGPPMGALRAARTIVLKGPLMCLWIGPPPIKLDPLMGPPMGALRAAPLKVQRHPRSNRCSRKRHLDSGAHQSHPELSNHRLPRDSKRSQLHPSSSKSLQAALQFSSSSVPGKKSKIQNHKQSWIFV